MIRKKENTYTVVDRVKAIGYLIAFVLLGVLGNVVFFGGLYTLVVFILDKGNAA